VYIYLTLSLISRSDELCYNSVLYDGLYIYLTIIQHTIVKKMKRTQKDWASEFRIYLREIPPKVFSCVELEPLFDNLRRRKILPSRLSYNKFLAEVISRNMINKTNIRYVGKANSRRKEFIRYTYKSPSSFSIALSLRSRSYLSHISALFLHGLTEQPPETIIVNKEQSAKNSSNELTQAGIDRAFKKAARQSNYIWAWKDSRFILLNGKQTGDFGVINIKIDTGEHLRATNLERTLVDIVVRPSYSGGVIEIVEAYRRARKVLSTKKIVQILKRLDYAYPYHQSIGFVMERAGFEKQQLDLLRNEGINFDFYLDYQIRNKAYDDTWRLYFPKGL